MRSYGELYKKELRQHRQEYGVLFFVTILSILTIIFDNPQVFSNTLAKLSWKYSKMSESFTVIQVFVSLLFNIFAPALLIYSLFDEKKSRSNAQSLFLPVPRYTLLLHKCLGILSMVLIAETMLVLARYNSSSNFVPITIFEMITRSLEQILILAITVAAIGISRIPRRNRVLCGFLAAFALYFVFLRFDYIPKIAGFLQSGTEAVFPALAPHYGFLIQLLYNTVGTAFFAGILYVAGFTLYHKLAEV